MTNERRRMLQWVVLVLAAVLTVISLVNLIRGEDGLVAWIGLICWPVVIAASVYNLVTGGKDGVFRKE